MLALIIAHAAVGALVVGLGDRLGRRAFAVAAAPMAATLVWALARSGDVVDGDAVTESLTWVGGLDLAFDLRFDAFSLVMVLLVAGVGVLVCAWSPPYFSHDRPGTGRLAGLLALFAGSMLGLVVSDHLLALFVFWELTSVTSYLLIGNDDRNPVARAAARQAILVTGAGGLVLLAGFVLLGQAAGTYRISELAELGEVLALAGSTVDVAVVLVLVGAFTKSAQAPFGSWLPGAMVAPTPISTYLHSATMVKAGVYLVARLAPVLAPIGAWRLVVLTVGATTMVMGGWRALRQHDLKLMLAYGTVSQLGFMMVLFGAGEYPMTQAGVVLLLAHGAFKAALFMVVGIVDHELGTRDIQRIGRLGRGFTPVIVITVVGAASMAGVPPLLGFIAKEKALDAIEGAGFAGATGALVAVMAGSVLTFAYSARFALGATGRLAAPDAGHEAASAHTPSRWLVWPPMVLTVLTVAAGVAPVLVDDLVRAATTAIDAAASPSPVRLWVGVNTALVLSVLVIGAGVVLVLLRAGVERAQRSVGRVTGVLPSSQLVYEATVDGIARVAQRITSVVQHGSLPLYLAVVVMTAAVVPAVPFLRDLDELPVVNHTWVHAPLAALIVVCAVAAATARRRVSAVLLLGAVGYLMAGLYVAEGAPDLALTQFAVETLATVMFVLVLRVLPRGWADSRRAVTSPVRLGVSGAVAAAVFVFALVTTSARDDVSEPPVSEEMVERAAPDAKGNNVVNVILVDFRGLDTLGEITVLVVAAVGAVGLARASRRRAGEQPRTAGAGGADVGVHEGDEEVAV
jgi:multicomponent Na+:H+ antiporter subunit A